MEVFCSELPKVELHAHLNGSVSDATIAKLSEAKYGKEKIITMEEKSFKNCFKLFDVVHDLTDSIQVIDQITTDVIDDFAKDNVNYLELRSTPKVFKEKGTTKRDYIHTIIDAINRHNHQNKDIDVRYIVSINRQHGLEEAQENVQLAKEFSASSDIVVGLELSGHPNHGSVSDFVPALQNAKQNGLKLALHVAEIADRDQENEAFLNLFPERIGHGTFLLENTAAYDLAKAHKIPIEIAITSNIACGTAASVATHHIKHWYDIHHPILVSTDDKEVFSTTLSDEYYKAAQACNLNYAETYNLSLNSIDHIFSNKEMKNKMRKKWKTFKLKNFETDRMIDVK